MLFSKLNMKLYLYLLYIKFYKSNIFKKLPKLLKYNFFFVYKNNLYNYKSNYNNIFLNYYFFLLKKKSNIFFNKYQYDLLFRFSKLSYFNIYLLKKILNISLYKNKIKKRKLKIKGKFIFTKLPLVSSLNLSFNNIFKRLHYLTVGNFNYLPLNYTVSGYSSPILISFKRKAFFSLLSTFLILKTFKFFLSTYYNNLNLYKFKSSYIFQQRVFNINFKILFFFTQNIKIENLKYINEIKSYNIFLSKKNLTNLFNFHYKNITQDNYIKKKKIPYINLKTKNKYLLKFHRLMTNFIFQNNFKSHRLSNFFYKIKKNKNYNFYKFLKNELNLCIFLIRIHFAFNLDDSQFLIRNGYVFVNKRVCYNESFILKQLDKIQLINSYDNYIVFRNKLSNNILKKSKLWYTSNKYKLILSKPYKTQPSKDKKWIYSLFWNLTDIPKFVEVDFQVYTAIIIYNPFNYFDIYPLFINQYTQTPISLLNWNYLY